VTLPSAKVEELSSLDRLRVVTSGCFHNLALWLILLGAAWSGLGPWILSVGYEDVSARGLIVANVDAVSIIPTLTIFTEHLLGFTSEHASPCGIYHNRT